MGNAGIFIMKSFLISPINRVLLELTRQCKGNIPASSTPVPKFLFGLLE